MKKCSNCGRELSEDSKFCDACGEKLIIPVQEIKCTHCGQVVNEGTIFCDQCGSRIIIKEGNKKEEVKKSSLYEKKQMSKGEQSITSSGMLSMLLRNLKSTNVAIFGIIILAITKIFAEFFTILYDGGNEHTFLFQFLYPFLSEWNIAFSAITTLCLLFISVISVVVYHILIMKNKERSKAQRFLSIFRTFILTVLPLVVIIALNDAYFLFLTVNLLMLFWSVDILSEISIKGHSRNFRIFLIISFTFYQIGTLANFALLYSVGVILMVTVYIMRGKKS